MAVFTSEQLAVFKEQFARFDTNGDGRIHGVELGPLMEALGLDTSAREVKTFLAGWDKDRNGSIDLDEFTALMLKKVKLAPLRAAFSALDKNGDGYITKEEMRKGMMASGMLLTDLEFECMMAKGDRDGDGKLSFDDFVVMMET